MHFFSLLNYTVVPFQNPDKTIPMPKKKKKDVFGNQKVRDEGLHEKKKTVLRDN